MFEKIPKRSEGPELFREYPTIKEGGGLVIQCQYFEDTEIQKGYQQLISFVLREFWK